MYQHQLELPAEPLRGARYLEQLTSKLDRLHEIGTARDKAHNRDFFFDQYVGLLLLYFFNPTVTSLRGLQEITDLASVRHRWKCPSVSRSALSEAGTVFDPAPLREIFMELGGQVAPARLSPQQAALRTLTAADGSLLPALPRMVWALWQDASHRAAKLHLHFEVGRGIPIEASITMGKDSEVRQLRQRLQAGRLYVLDRGYAAYGLMADILAARASFIVRIKDNMAFTVQEERPVSPDVQADGVVRDAILCRVGTSHHKREIHHPLRLVEIETKGAHVFLLTDQLDLPAELVALAYRNRWTVELFFRWLKCILGCRHWLGESLNALTIQVYVGLIASLLLAIWSRQKFNKRTFEMVCHFFAGWATEEELQRHLDQSIKQKSGP
jgi:IS4 transposase